MNNPHVAQQVLAPIEPVAAMPLATTATVITPADLLRIAMERNDGDLDRLERLMAMERQWRADKARDAFRADFAAFRGENIIIPKTRYVDRGKAGSFNQAEYDEVCRRLSPALSAHGFSFRHDMKFGSRKWMTDGVESDIPWVTVTCYLEHREGHAEILTMDGPPGELSANTPVQNMQVTASYLKRQSLLAITGTATGGEDDEGAMRRGKSPAADDGDDLEASRLVDEGNAEAEKGEAALIAWWGALTAAQRNKAAPFFAAMKAAARKAGK